MLPKHLNCPLTIIASLVHKASHSSILCALNCTLKTINTISFSYESHFLLWYICIWWSVGDLYFSEKYHSLFEYNNNLFFPFPNLCDVSMTLLPSLITLVSASQRNLLVAGSIPVVGSSSSSIGGLPTRAIAVLSLRLLPPLYTGKNSQ